MPESVRYEHKDVRPRSLLISSVAFIGALLLVGGLLHLMNRFVYNHDFSTEFRSIPPPPRPALEEHPADSIAAYMEQQSRSLNSVEWIDRDSGIVFIPIDRAMDMVVEDYNNPTEERR